MNLHSFEISCWFKSDKFMVSINRDRKGQVRLYPSSFMGHGEGGSVHLKPEEIDEFAAFLTEAREEFNKLYTVNQEYMDAQDETTTT